jgi:L-histidine Nalpha-methyltransferase
MPPSRTAGIPIEVLLGPDDLLAGLRADVLAGLTSAPKQLSPTWFYDDRGCELFEAITRLPEYYPTRTERSILGERADEIAERTGADTLVELGSGTSEKTRLLLDALAATGALKQFVGFDVAETTLRSAGQAIVEEYPGVEVRGVVGDFRRHLPAIPAGGRQLIAFLGGTIGNLEPDARASFLSSLATTMAPGDSLLLGTDLVKGPARLEAAYDDRAGVTAEFNRNVLRVLNRELGADFDPDRFDHVARWNDDEEWIEMRLRSRGAQTIDIPELDLTVHFDDGEELRTEISAKFRPEQVATELRDAGLEPAGWWTDPAGDFGVSLAVR